MLKNTLMKYLTNAEKQLRNAEKYLRNTKIQKSLCKKRLQASWGDALECSAVPKPVTGILRRQKPKLKVLNI